MRGTCSRPVGLTRLGRNLDLYYRTSISILDLGHLFLPQIERTLARIAETMPSLFALADLFTNQPNYLQKISDFCIADLTKQLTKALGNLDGTTIQDGAGPKAENFQYFLINPSTSSGQATITFYFPKYQVAFGAAGYFKVIYPK